MINNTEFVIFKIKNFTIFMKNCMTIEKFERIKIFLIEELKT
jgi:hypothetical protein